MSLESRAWPALINAVLIFKRSQKLDVSTFFLMTAVYPIEHNYQSYEVLFLIIGKTADFNKTRTSGMLFLIGC